MFPATDLSDQTWAVHGSSRGLWPPSGWGDIARFLLDRVESEGIPLNRVSLLVPHMSYISSHSGRQMGACADALLDIGWQAVMVWGS
jgi:hypothetical protein